MRQNGVGFKPADVVIRFKDARAEKMRPQVVRGSKLTGHDRFGYRKIEAVG